MVFGFLKRIFGSSETEKAEVKFSELGEWFEKTAAKKFSEFEGSAKKILDELKTFFKELDEHITKLENAEVKEQDKAVQDKVKNIVEGNRSNYARQMRIFLDGINVPEPKYEKAAEFIEEIEKRLNELGKGTQKSYFTAQHLFYDEVEAIASDLKRISSIMTRLKGSGKNLEALNKTKHKIKAMYEKKELKKKLEAELGQMERSADETREIMMKKEAEQKRFMKSSEFTELYALKKKLAESEKKIDEHSFTLSSLFSKIERPLRKYSKLTVKEELAKSYLDDCTAALLKDEKLEILKLLSDMRVQIVNGTINLKDRKKDSSLKTLDTMTKAFFEGFVKEHKEMIKVRENTAKALRQNNAGFKAEEMEKELRLLKARLKDAENQLEDSYKTISGININAMANDVCLEIRDAVKIEVTIDDI